MQSPSSHSLSVYLGAFVSWWRTTRADSSRRPTAHRPGWFTTTRSHVFTIYGTLRGSGQKSEVDQKAIRFQETVDRMPCFFDRVLPQRIGQLVVGNYADARSN